jgi:hypothetical protein
MNSFEKKNGKFKKAVKKKNQRKIEEIEEFS